MAKTTKQEILEAALEIFARDGHDGTNIKDIAEAVGLVKSGLYKHYDGKEAIWNAAIDTMSQYYDEHMGARKENMKIPETLEELYQMTMGMVNFTLHDHNVILVRKILAQEQFRDEKIRKLANAHFVYDIADMYSRIFTEMMNKGCLKKCDPEILAFSYSSPISVLIHMCDRSPEKEPEVMAKIDKFVKQFIDEYGIREA